MENEDPIIVKAREKMMESSSDDIKRPNRAVVSLKTKVKSHRPIILLRRNSCGNIQTHSNAIKKPKKIPRLKSLTDIELKPKSVGKISSPKVKVEKVLQPTSFEALQQSISATTTSISAANIKTESNNLWVNNINVQNLPTNVSQSPEMCHPSPKPEGQFFSGNLQYQNNQFVKNEINYPNSFMPNQAQGPFPTQMMSQNGLSYGDTTLNQGAQCIYPSTNQFGYIQGQYSGGMQFPNTFMQQTGDCFQQGQPFQYFNPNQQMHVTNNFGHSPIDDSLTNITWLGRMGVNNFMPVPLERERKYERDRRGRPPYSYMALIQFAINSSSTGRMTLRQIYQWIEDKFPYFKNAKPGWKNSIRHNLSLHDIFVREVAAGSKASYWTLRADLNMRPLTLDSLRGGAQHAFQDCNPKPIQQVWPMQQVPPGQKPILPRLPQCSRPYVLLPVPLIQTQADSGMMTSPQPQQEASPHQQMDSDSVSHDATSTSFFADSGFHSDISHSTPSGSSERPTMVKLHLDQDVSPMLSQANVVKSGSQKKSRKAPLKTLNDSLNSSLHFLKESSESDSRSPSPRQHRSLSPSGTQFLLCKKLHKQNTKNQAASKPPNLGISEETFSEILNDLGSPFKDFLSQNISKSSPKVSTARKRRRSWGSPESSYESNTGVSGIRRVNETTPISQQIRRVKSEAGDLTKAAHATSSAITSHLPTSTPLCKEKWKKSLKYKSSCEPDENQENVCPHGNHDEPAGAWLATEQTPLRTPSPIPSSSRDDDLHSEFLQDIMGTVFKTPDRPTTAARHFVGLSPTDRVPFADVTSRHVVSVDQACGSNQFLTTPVKVEALDSSFTKLLDLSGGSGSFSRINTHFSDITDLNLSWSSLTQL